MQHQFLTLPQLREELEKLGERLEKSLEEKLGKKLEKKFDGKLTKLKSDIFDKLDYIIAELETTREDRILAVYQTRNHGETLEDHEKRITHLEKQSSAK